MTSESEQIMTPESEQILQEAFEHQGCDGCWQRLQELIERLEAKPIKQDLAREEQVVPTQWGDALEKEYLRGQQMAWKNAWSSMLAIFYRHLNPEEKKLAALIIERTKAVETLHRLCAEYGSDEWPNNLALSDVIEKYLVNPMAAEIRELKMRWR